MTPVNKPKACITTGKNKGVIPKRMATITVPLIMLPYSLTAKARVLDNSPIILNGSMMKVGLT